MHQSDLVEDSFDSPVLSKLLPATHASTCVCVCVTMHARVLQMCGCGLFLWLHTTAEVILRLTVQKDANHALHRRSCNPRRTMSTFASSVTPVEGDAAPSAAAPGEGTARAPASKMEAGKRDQVEDCEGDGGGNGVDVEEMMVHIKGLMFNSPGIGVGRITKELNKLGGAYAKLHDKRVRKHMKKEGLLQSQLEEDNKAAGVIRMLQVGVTDAPHKTAAPPPAAAAPRDGVVLVELKVPADRSGSRPAQMTIAHSRLPDSLVAEAPRPELGTIYKIQIALGGAHIPMLCYNQGRSQSTYIHADAPGYAEIRERIVREGVPGAAQAQGGLKAYFYGRQTRETGRGFVWINTSQLAPTQPW
jgi:hypothetical protein